MTTPIEVHAGYRAKVVSTFGRFDFPAPNITRLAPPFDQDEAYQPPLQERAIAFVDLGEKHQAAVVDYPGFTAVGITGPDTEEHFALFDRQERPNTPIKLVIFDSNDKPVASIERETDPNIQSPRLEYHIQGSIFKRTAKTIKSIVSRLYQAQRYIPIGI